MILHDKNYNCTFSVDNTPHEVFDAICCLQDWWTKNVTGQALQKEDIFTVQFGETQVSFSIAEIVPDQKIVWQVTDSFLHWLNDKKEWNNTKIVFNITGTNEGTKMSMTHIGIRPGIECYENCRKGWDFYAGNSLRKLITDKKGMPDTKQSERQQ